MLTNPGSGRRLSGKALIALAAAAALPLTASRATEYVDVPLAPAAQAKAAAMPLPHASPAPAAATSMAVSGAAAAATEPAYRENPDGTVTLSGGVVLDKGSTAFFEDDRVLINGKVKSLEELSKVERTKLRAVIADAQRDLVRDRARLPRELAEAKREADSALSGELRREHMRDIEDLRRDLADIDREAAEMRADGEDPAKVKAEILRDLREAEAADIAREEREAIAEADPARAEAELRNEEQQMARMLARLDQLEGR